MFEVFAATFEFSISKIPILFSPMDHTQASQLLKFLKVEND